MTYDKHHVFFCCCNQREPGETLLPEPHAAWYIYVDRFDIDEIVDEHLAHNRILERLPI